MNECRDCELVIYCYAEPGNWMFRTREEMTQTQARIASCPVSSRVQALQVKQAADGCCARPSAAS
jgi:hypothetical protein